MKKLLVLLALGAAIFSAVRVEAGLFDSSLSEREVSHVLSLEGSVYGGKELRLTVMSASGGHKTFIVTEQRVRNNSIKFYVVFDYNKDSEATLKLSGVELEKKNPNFLSYERHVLSGTVILRFSNEKTYCWFSNTWDVEGTHILKCREEK